MNGNEFNSYFMGGALALKFLILAALVVYHLGLYKLFEKADKKAWKALIPFYNVISIVEIVHRPKWWASMIILGFIIPIIAYFSHIAMLNLFEIIFIPLAIIILIELAKSFDKPTPFLVGMIILPVIFIMIIGFDDSQYLIYKEKDFKIE